MCTHNWTTPIVGLHLSDMGMLNDSFEFLFFWKSISFPWFEMFNFTTVTSTYFCCKTDDSTSSCRPYVIIFKIGAFHNKNVFHKLFTLEHSWRNIKILDLFKRLDLLNKLFDMTFSVNEVQQCKTIHLKITNIRWISHYFWQQ